MHQHHQTLLCAIEWLNAGNTIYLFHVAQTWGSSPRPVGSLMAVTASGQHIGSVSGGCVEADLFRRIAEDEFKEVTIKLIKYDNKLDKHITLPCRGQMQLLLEVVDNPEQLQPALEAIRTRQAIVRQIDVSSLQVRYSQQNTYQASFDGQILSEPYGPNWRVLLIGANDLAIHVTRQCQALDYEVIISEPREEYRNNWIEADCEVTSLMPDEAVDRYARDEYTAVLALSHDPKLDDLAIMQALYSPAFYVGALGSRRSAQRRENTLVSMQLDAERIRKLDAPIGLNIGSRSPAEIAVAIAAKLIQVRNSRVDSGQPASQQQS